MEFVLRLLSYLLLTTRAAAASTAILDVDGDELQRGQLYHVTSARNAVAGLSLATLNDSCPLYVAQESLNDLRGRPLAFFPENPNDDTVREGNTVYIMVPEPTECPESTVWKLDQKTGYVTTGGSSSKSALPVYSRFSIRKVGDSSPDYQIEVCPCSMGVDWASCHMSCTGTLGLDEEGTKTLLGVKSNSPHTVYFEKVNKEAEPSRGSQLKAYEAVRCLVLLLGSYCLVLK